MQLGASGHSYTQLLTGHTGHVQHPTPGQHLVTGGANVEVTRNQVSVVEKNHQSRINCLFKSFCV